MTRGPEPTAPAAPEGADPTVARLATLVAGLDTAVLVEDERRLVVFANERFCELFAVPVPPSALNGSDCASAARAAAGLFVDPAGFLTRVDAILAARQPVRGDVLEMTDGRILERDYFPVVIDSHHRGNAWQYRDVTDTQRATRELADLKRFYEQVLDALPVELAVFDGEGRYQFVSRHAVSDPERRQWMIGRTDLDYAKLRGFPAELGQHRAERLLEAIASKRGLRYEESLVDREGRTRYYSRFLTPILDAEGRVTQVLGYGLDISDQRRAELDGAAERARKAAILDAANDAIITADAAGHIIELNPITERMFGFSREHLIGREAVALFIPPEFLEAARAEAREGRDFGRWHGQMERTLQRADGTRFEAEVEVLPIAMPDGTRLFTAYIRDLSERKQRAAELKAAKELAEQSAQAKQEFLANMSHELRTPLNAVVGLTHLLARTTLTPDQGRYLEGIRFSSDQLLSTINDILDLSKIDSGRIQFETVPFEPVKMVEGVVGSLRFGAEQKGLVLVSVIDPAVPPVLVGDPVRLNQVLLNLVGNAVKFTERGSVTVTVGVSRRDGERVIVQFAVTDSGIGIAPDRLATIFEPFSQGRTDTTRRFGGTGLGLTIVRQLVELQGGEIAVTSTPGQGSCFTVTLAFGVAEEIPVPAANAAGEVRLDGVRILLVEDNELNQTVATELLAAAGADVVVAASGLGALGRLRSERFDVVLMDLQMPEMDGFEATIRIRRELGLSERTLPILALSAAGLVEERRRAEAAGMNGFVGKPFRPAELVARIAEQVGRVVPTPAVARPLGGGTGLINRRMLDEYTYQDVDLARRVLGIFISTTPAKADQLRRCFAEGRLRDAADAAHQLKSPAGFIGAQTLWQLLNDVEGAARADAVAEADLEKLFPLIDQVVAEAERVRKVL
ncbi:MAG: ATP-binding protein [Gemmatimonadales bacterium]